MAPELPGFYYGILLCKLPKMYVLNSPLDTEKKKYFKILKAHQLLPGREDCKYSADKIAAEKKKEKKQKKAYRHLDKRKRETVVSTYTNDFLSFASLAREIGHRRETHHMRRSWPNASAFGFQLQTIVSDTPIRYFDRDPMSKTLYAVKGETSIQRRRPDPLVPILETNTLDDDCHTHLNAYTFEPWDTLAQLTSPVSSLNYLPGSGALCITTCGADRSPVVYLTDPDRDDPFLGEMYTPRYCNTIWGSAARPLSFSPFPSTNSIPEASTECLAVGLSLIPLQSPTGTPATATEHPAQVARSALMLFSRTNAGRWETSTPLSLESDILALDWLSENTVAMGCRNGEIHIYDTRSKGSSNITKHPRPISKLRRADDFTRLVVSGLDNTCMLYDMRMSRPQPQSRTYQEDLPPMQNSLSGESERRNNHTRDNRRKRKRHPQFTSASYVEPPSQPLLRFQHDNAEDLELGLDVHAGLGLVAAAQADTKIKISNLWTGKLIKEFDMHEDGSTERINTLKKGKANRIRCLKWINDGDGEGISLWASGEGGIKRFGW
jgi:WD40 repeat protein